MKVNSEAINLTLVVGALFGLFSNPAQAATVSFSDPNPNGGIGYEWTVQLNDEETVQFTRHVGVKSWNEPANPPGLKGWTHTSDWVALTLTEATKLTIQVERTASVPINATTTAGNSLFPAFTLFSGQQNSGAPDAEWHQYNNKGNSFWTVDLDYLNHEANSRAASLVLRTFKLPAGEYSLAIGGNPFDPTLVGRHGYTATLFTVSVPEPSTTNGLLLVSLGAVLGATYRRGARLS